MPRVYSALLVTLMFLGSSSASAEVILLANLTNAQENPPAVPTTTTGAPRPASFGTALFTLNDAMTSMSFSATIFNIDFTGTQTADVNDNLTAAHIHAGPNVTPTTNAGVVWGFFGMPFNDTNPTNVVVTPFAAAVGGTVAGAWDALEGNNTTLAAQLDNILNNRSYINFHTSQFGGGEARGLLEVQASQPEPIPEPSTMMLVGLGAAGLVRAARRRRKEAAV